MASYGGLPDFSTYLSNADELKAAATPAPQGPEASGTGNWFTAGLGSGYHGALANVGGLGEALARVAGYDTGADAAAQFADEQRAQAATYARKDLEEGPWYTPGGLGYRLAQMIPGAAVGLAGAVGGAALAPEEAAAAALTGIGGFAARHAAAIGGSVAAYPLVVGENVNQRKEYAGELSQGQAAKALALGVPEAALQGIVPAKLESMLAGEVGQTLTKAVRNTALAQVPAAAVTEYLTQQMGDPNRPLAERAQEIVTAGLQGGVLGGLQAGLVHPVSSALHAIAKTPVQNVTPGGLFDTINRALNPVEPSHPVPPVLALPAPEGGNVPQLQAPQFFAGPRLNEQPENVSRVPSDATVLRPDQTRPEQEVLETKLLEPPQRFAGERSVRGLSGQDLEDARAEANRVPSGATIIAGPPIWRGMADATEQLSLPLELPEVQAANRNEPPTLRAATPQPEPPVYRTQEELRKAGMAPVQVGRETVNAPANKNTEGERSTAEPTGQLTFSFGKPGDAEIGNKPTLTGKVTPQPEAPVVTTQEGLRKAGLAPVEVGKETINAPANDKFDQTPLQADLNKLPDLRKREFKTQDEAQAAVAEAIVSREAAGRAAPPALERVGKALGVIKEDGSIDPKFTGAADTPEGPHETLQAGPQAPEVVGRDAVPAQHQGRYDRLQELRDRLGDNLNDPETFGLVSRVTNLQNELQDVKGSARTGQINREINQLRGDIETRERGPAPQPSDPKALASSTQPTPDAAAFIAARQGQPVTAEAKAKARKSGKAVQEAPEPVRPLPENIPAVNPLEAAQDAEAQDRMTSEGGPAPREVPEPAPTQEATRKASRAAKAADATAAAETTPASADTERKPNFGERMAAKRAQARLDAVANAEEMKRQKRESQTIQAVETEVAKPTPKTPITPEIAEAIGNVRKALEVLKAQKPKGTIGKATLDFNKAIAAHERQLAVIEKAAQEGGLEALQNFRRDHFDDVLWSDALGKLTPEGEASLAAHANAETDLIEAITALRGERPLIRYETQPTVHDVNVSNVISATGKANDAFAFIRQTDPSPMNRMMASILERLGLDTSIRMASDERMLEDTTRKLGEGELIAGSHNDQLNRINVYSGSNVAQTVLHEGFHAATVRALASGSRAASDMRALFDRVKARAGDSTLYGLSSPEEMVAEAGSNPTFQQFLRSEPVQTGSKLGDMWQAFKNAMFKTLGMPERVRTAFDQIMDGTQKLMAENPTRAAIVSDRPLIVERGIKKLAKVVDMIGNEGLSRIMREAEGIPSNLTRNARDGILGWVGPRDIAQANIKDMPTQARYVESAIKTEDRKDTMYKSAAVVMHSLKDVSKKGLEAIDRVAARAVQGIDGTKPWAQHTHLHESPKADVLKAEHAQAERDMNVLRRIDGGKALAAYENMRAEYDAKFELNNLRKLWDHVEDHQSDLIGKVKGFETNPFDDYDRAYADHDDPKAALKWAKEKSATVEAGLAPVHSTLLRERDRLANLIKNDNNLVKSKDPNALSRPGRAKLEEQFAEAQSRFKELDGTLKEIDADRKRQAQSPYFHVGREGNHFVAASLAADENGVVNEAAITALGDMLQAKGFKDVAVMQGLVPNKFYVRLGSQTERELLASELSNLKGHIVEGSIKRGLADNQDIFDGLSSSKMREIVNQVKANKPEYPAGATDAQKTAIDRAHAQNVSEVMRSLIETIPQSSLDRLYQRRQGVQGFDTSAVRNFRAAAHSNAGGLANLTMAREAGEARKAMRDQMKALQGDLNLPGEKLDALQQSYNELLARSQHVETYSTTSAIDAFRKLGHVISVGLSPAYVMALGSQVATLTWPQLGSVHGFVKSARAMANVTNDVFKMVSAVAKGPDKATFGVRQSTLEAAGLNKADIDFHLDMARRGVYNKSYTEDMTGHDASTGLGRAMHYANAMGRYAEMVPRVQAALAARDLYNEELATFNARKAKAPGLQPTGVLKDFATANDYAAHVVNESQLDWHSANTPRQATRAGMFGVMSPIINQFMGYQTRLTAKLYREVHGALGGDAQSKKWLLGHAAAVATLAGTLGLPMVSVAASVYDRLADWVTGQDDHDVIASYRTFLASTFGKEVGEVIARGAPRAIGIDFDHAGEGKIAPGSTTLMMLTEKRKLEDAERDWLKAEAGHAVGLMFHLAFAARDVMNGDYLEASERVVPELLKGPVEAYRLAERNFVDKNGQRLPITANATDIMMTAMGIDPAKEAEYNEEQRTITGLNAMRQARSQNITRHLLLAQARGDGAMFQDWERQATQFQLDHPGMAGPLQDFGRAVATHSRAVAIARGFGTPLGVKTRDVVGREKTSFGNLRQGNE